MNELMKARIARFRAKDNEKYTTSCRLNRPHLPKFVVVNEFEFNWIAFINEPNEDARETNGAKMKLFVALTISISSRKRNKSMMRASQCIHNIHSHATPACSPPSNRRSNRVFRQSSALHRSNRLVLRRLNWLRSHLFYHSIGVNLKRICWARQRWLVVTGARGVVAAASSLNCRLSSNYKWAIEPNVRLD